MRTKRFWGAAAATLMTAALLTGCSTSTSGGQGNATGGGKSLDGIKWPTYKGSTTLTVWDWTPDTKYIPLFKKMYPNIKINLQNVGGGSVEYAKLTTADAAGSGAPDDVRIEYPYVPQFIASKSLTDISTLVKPQLAQLPASALSQVSSGSGIYDFPQNGGTLGLIYRPDVLQKYKLAVPTSWTEFAQSARALHKANPKMYMTYFPNNDPEHVMGLVQQAGVQAFKQATDGSWTVNIDNPQSRALMSMWGGLISDGAVKVQADFTPEWQSAIVAGDYAMYTAPEWFAGNVLAPYLPKGQQKFTITTLPSWTAGQTVVGNWGGSGYAVPSQSKSKQAAALFAAFMDLGAANAEIKNGTLPEANTLTRYPNYAKTAGTVPGFSQSVVQTYQGIKQKAQAVDPSVHFSPWTTVLNNSLNSEEAKAVAGTIPWSDVLRNVQAAVVSYAKSQGATIRVG